MDTQRALEWLTGVLSVQGRELTINDTRDTVAEWDSLGDLLLLANLEEQLELILSADDIAALSSIRQLVSFLEKNNAFSAR